MCWWICVRPTIFVKINQNFWYIFLINLHQYFWSDTYSPWTHWLFWQILFRVLMLTSKICSGFGFFIINQNMLHFWTQSFGKQDNCQTITLMPKPCMWMETEDNQTDQTYSPRKQIFPIYFRCQEFFYLFIIACIY